MLVRSQELKLYHSKHKTLQLCLGRPLPFQVHNTYSGPFRKSFSPFSSSQDLKNVHTYPGPFEIIPPFFQVHQNNSFDTGLNFKLTLFNHNRISTLPVFFKILPNFAYFLLLKQDLGLKLSFYSFFHF